MAVKSLALPVGALVLALAVAGTQAQSRPKKPDWTNRGVDSIHQPIVERTDYVLDLAAAPGGLASGEADRLAGWFDGLGLGYGDTIALDDPAGRRAGAARDDVAEVLGRYGMLLSRDPAPVTAGRAAAGSIRVVVSRAVAHVEGCPDWHRVNNEFQGASMSNFGCASANNLAAMVANPQDLIEGRSGERSSDAMLSVKAIQTYRDAPATGAKGLKNESSKSGGSGSGGSN